MTLDKEVEKTPAGDAASADATSWLRRSLLLIGGLLLFRLFYAAIVPLDLVHDEAYYWDWSRQLDWGYYSKPPMIAWLIAASTSLGGSTAFFVRLPAVLLSSGGLLAIWALASRLYGSKAGFWATALWAFTPGNAVVSLLMTIDAPFLCFWSVALFAFWRMIERPERRTGWLLAAIAATGLGILSKQTMLGFLPLAGIFLLLGREDRRELLRPAFWIWAFGSVLFLTPVVWWNWQHNWITIEHTSSHFSGGSDSVLRRLVVFLEFLGSQFGVASPVTAFLFAACVVAVLCRVAKSGWIANLGRRERYLFCFSGLPMLGVLCLALTQRVEPNWPAGFFPAGVILLTGWLLGGTTLPAWPQFDQRALRRALTVGAICMVGAYLLPFGLGLQGTKFDPAVRLRGWQQLGEHVGERISGQLDPARSILIVTADRAAASELAFYLPSHPQTYTWNPSGHVGCQYDIWGGPKDKPGWDALIVTPIDASLPADLQAAFAAVEDQGEVKIPIGAGRLHAFRLYRGLNLRAWPDPPIHVASPPSPRAKR